MVERLIFVLVVVQGVLNVYVDSHPVITRAFVLDMNRVIATKPAGALVDVLASRVFPDLEDTRQGTVGFAAVARHSRISGDLRCSAIVVHQKGYVAVSTVVRQHVVPASVVDNDIELVPRPVSVTVDIDDVDRHLEGLL